MSRLFPKSDPEKDTAIMLGDPKKAIYVTVIPFMISIFIGQVNMLADVMWCSGLGSDYISAIQVVSPIYWVIFDVGLGIGLGCNVLIARRIGAGDRIGAQSIISHGFILAVAIAIILAPLMFILISPMMSWMDASQLTDMSVSYLLPILICNVFQVLSPTLSGFLRGEGAAKKSNYAIIIGTVINIVLDPVFIYGLEMGVMGAGIATAISFIISSSVMIHLYISGNTTLRMTFKGFKFQLSEAKEIMFIGFPKMIEMFMMDLLDAFNRVFLIQCGGIDAVTLFSVPFRLLILAAMVSNSFGMALTPVSSANLGAKRPDKSIVAYKVCLKCMFMISFGLMVVYLVFAEFLIMPFLQSESMVIMEPALVDILRIDAFMIPAIGLSFICNAMLQSMRKPLLALLVTFSRNLVTTIAFALLDSTSVDLMCAGMVVVTIIAGIAAFLMTRISISNMLKAYRPVAV